MSMGAVAALWQEAADSCGCFYLTSWGWAVGMGCNRQWRMKPYQGKDRDLQS